MHTREVPDFWGLHKNLNCAFPLCFGKIAYQVVKSRSNLIIFKTFITQELMSKRCLNGYLLETLSGQLPLRKIAPRLGLGGQFSWGILPQHHWKQYFVLLCGFKRSISLMTYFSCLINIYLFIIYFKLKFKQETLVPSICYLFPQNSTPRVQCLTILLEEVFLLSKFDGHRPYITEDTKIC